MMKCNKEAALKIAIDLAKTNLESTQEWVHPDDVNFFIEEVYALLTGEKERTDN